MPKYISKAQTNANQRNISDLRYLARNNIIVPYSLDTHKNSTLSQIATLKILNPLNCLYIKKS